MDGWLGGGKGKKEGKRRGEGKIGEVCMYIGAIHVL